MKTNLSSLALSLAILSGFAAWPLSAAPENKTAVMYPVSEVWTKGDNAIKPGTLESSVLAIHGRPTVQPSENVWIYHRYTANLEEANARDCHNLLLTFVDHRVKEVMLINDEAVKVIVAEAKQNPNALPAAIAANR